MNAYRRILSPAEAGANLRFTYKKYASDHHNHSENYAEYLLREDGLLYGRGSRVYSGGDSSKYVSMQDFTLVDTDIADIDDCYLLKCDGSLYCIYPGEKTNRILLPLLNYSSEVQPVKVMDEVKQHLHSHPNEFVLCKDGTVFGWGLNWRKSLGTGLNEENISQPVYVTDHTSRLIHGDMPYQTFVLKDDHSLWHWSPVHGHFRPVWLSNHISDLSFTPNGDIIVLNDKGELFSAVLDENTSDEYKNNLVKQNHLENNIKSVQFSQFLIAAIRQDRTMALWHMPLSGEKQISKLDFSLPNVEQYLLASDSVIALDKDGKLYHIVHYFLGNESKLLIELLSDDISCIDSFLSNGIDITGASAIDKNGCLIEYRWLLPWHKSDECTIRRVFENNVLHTIDAGHFVVCKDGSVWER